MSVARNLVRRTLWKGQERQLLSYEHLSFKLFRPLSTYLALFAPRRDKNRPPLPVPKWANYDGNQPCYAEDEDTSRLIWEGYKRNFKGNIPPKKTRISCIRGKKMTGNPCPICSRQIDIQHTNTNLLSQFICPHSGKILKPKKTGLCRKQQKKLEGAIELARDWGHLPFAVRRQLPEEPKRTPPFNKIDILD